MRGSTWLVGTGLVLTLYAAPSYGSASAEREPVTGGFASTPALETPAPPAGSPDAVPATAPPSGEAATPAAPAAPTTAAASPEKKADSTSWGVLVRGGYFGLPDTVADKLFNQHPEIDGSSFGAELRYHGADGGRGVASIGLAIDAARAESEGIWQEDASDPPTAGSGEVEMLALTVTGYWNLFPTWYVHPYVGVGIGIAHVEGSYQDDEEFHTIDYWVPAIHLPAGLAVELGERFQLAAEVRFIDGITAGGALQVRF